MKGPVMQATEPSVVEILASVTGSAVEDWEDLDGPDSGVGVDFWYRHRTTEAEAYANLDQDHLTISMCGERLYDGTCRVGEPTK